MASDVGPNRSQELSDDGASGPVGGERLVAARRARNISVHEIAKELHLDALKVRALEENRFEVLGPPVFAKGYLRKYANIVGVPIDDILADYYKLNRATGAPPVVGPPRKSRRRVSVGPGAVGVIVVVALVIAGWWWVSAIPVSKPVTIESASPSAAVTEPSLEIPTDNAEGSEQLQAAEVETQPEAEPETVDVPEQSLPMQQPAAGTVEIELVFSGDCWAEVTDASGQRLFFGLATEGRSVSLSGTEPLGVLLGDSSNVTLRVNGADYAIPAANRRGKTARLTIYGR